MRPRAPDSAMGCLIICLMASRMAVAHPLPLTAIIISHCSSVFSMKSRRGHQTPALLINMSILESFYGPLSVIRPLRQIMDQHHRTLTVNSIKAKISAVLPISHFWYAEVPPLFAMTVWVGICLSSSKPCWAHSSLMSEQTTWAPSRANARAIPLPMPDEAPVTMAIRPCNRPDPSTLYLRLDMVLDFLES